MWIEKKGLQYRVYWRNKTGEGPARLYVPFATNDEAETFREMARLLRSPERALWCLESPENFDAAFAPLTAPAASLAAKPSTRAVAVVPADPGAGTLSTEASPDLLTEVVFDVLWEKYLREARHLEGTTRQDYEGYYRNHFQPFFGGVDLGLIRRAKPLKASLAAPGTVYVDDWVEQMLAKEKLNNVHRPVAGSRLSYKTIKNVLDVLGQVFDVGIHERPALLEVNWAREIRLPKQDRREMHFLEDAGTFLQLLLATDKHFRPLLTFLVGTGARFGEAAGLLTKHVHLDAEQPYIEIRLILKWMQKKWRLGRPKTKSSVRRISLSPKLVELLRPLVAGKEADDHVFTMVEGKPLHHGNFYNRYFRKGVANAGGRVPKKLRIHDLRHTHAAWLLSAGAPLFVVQRRLGHSSITTTADVYGHMTPEADRRTLAIVDRHLPEEFLGPDDGGAQVIRLSRWETELEEFDVDDLDDLAA